MNLPQSTFAAMTKGAQLLEQDAFGPKVFRLVDGNMLKIFRRKRLLSTAMLWPHSQRFWQNAQGLTRRGILTVAPLALYRLDRPGRTAVLYRPLPGETVTDLVRQSAERQASLLPDLALFINRLHDLGIYFRSLHPGNIVLTPEGTLGLIDISDMQFRNSPLGAALIRRNREHFEKYVRKEGLALDSAALWATCDAIRRHGQVP